MNLKIIIGLIILQIALAGCATSVAKDFMATGGSRADGTIQLSYEHAAFEQPKIDFAKGLETARSRCAAWGYSSAEQGGDDGSAVSVFE